MLLLFFSAFVVGLSGAMMPDSLLTYTIRQSLSNGAKAGFIIVPGHTIPEFSLVTLIFWGLVLIFFGSRFFYNEASEFVETLTFLPWHCLPKCSKPALHPQVEHSRLRRLWQGRLWPRRREPTFHFPIP